LKEVKNAGNDQEDQNRATAGFTVTKEAEANLPTEYGLFRIVGFRSQTSDEEFVALVKGEIDPQQPVLVRIHSQCLTGDVFGSGRCDCGDQLRLALRRQTGTAPALERLARSP